MVSLSPLQHGKLYQCAADALRIALGEAQDDNASNATQIFPDVVIAITVAVHSAVHEACADFMERCNDLYPDLVRRLPTEALLECFRFLPFRDRISVSHVSRAWRRVSLADGFMWTEAKVWGYGSYEQTMLSVLLSRSYPLPFHLDWHPSVASDSVISTLVAQNLDRIQSLKLMDAPPYVVDNIFNRSAPSLRNLAIGDDWRDSYPLPGQRGSLHAPHLRSLVVQQFSVPVQFEPLLSLREFEGGIASDVAGLPHLFDIFPGLVSLTLHDVTDQHLSLLSDIPRTIVDIKLSGSLSGTLDVSSFIENRLSGAVRNLTIHNARIDIPAASDVFTTRVRGTWSMIISFRTNSVKLRGNDDAILYNLQSKQYFGKNTIHQLFLRSLDRLSSLTVPTEALLGLCDDRLVWNRTLPSLRSLTITDDCLFDVDPGVWHHPIHLAQLEELTVTIDNGLSDADNVRYVAVALPDTIPVMIEYSYTQTTVRIEARCAQRLLDEDISRLGQIARRVQVKDPDQRSGAIAVDLLDGVCLHLA